MFQADTACMVFPDLSFPQTRRQQISDQSFPAIASVNDRFLAFALDFLIFSPVISLFIAGMLRQLKTFFLISSTSQEGYIAAGLITVMVVVITVLLQTVFMFYWQATPGQVFLQLKVVAYPYKQNQLSLSQLTLSQCLVRSSMWCLSFGFMGLPFLEILSHSLRRTIYERASDTIVVTLKRSSDEGPMPLEARFVSSWLKTTFLFMAFFGVIAFFKVYYSLAKGAYRESANGVASLCKEIPEASLKAKSRLDTAVALFLLNDISADCLNKEAEFSLWENSGSSQELAYLAKFLIVDSHSEQKKYFSKLCSDSRSSVCALARYLKDDGKTLDLENADKNLLLTRLLLSEEKFVKNDFEGSLKIIKELQSHAALKTALEKRYVRSIWALNELERSHSKEKGRGPASASVRNLWIETFKEKYEVP
ncbi:MAG: RDD family protein [Pseudobdellovibrionaceae bacterium]